MQVGESYSGLESMAVRHQRLKDRKISNTRTNISFGFNGVPYTTTAQVPLLFVFLQCFLNF
jgi:hypothetical protein